MQDRGGTWAIQVGETPGEYAAAPRLLAVRHAKAHRSGYPPLKSDPGAGRRVQWACA